MRRFAVIAIALLSTLSAPCIYAQQEEQMPDSPESGITRNNPYKIDDRLYPLFARANRMRASRECLLTADTLENEAVRLGDLKAQCLAHIARFLYYCGTDNLDSISIAAAKTKEIARKNGYLQYFYQASSTECTRYIANSRFSEAQKLLDRMHQDATEDAYPMGFYQCYIQTAHIYRFKSNYPKAVHYYLLAAHYMEENIPDQSPSNAYLQASQACTIDDDFEHALEYARKGLETFSTNDTHIHLYAQICSSLYFLGRTGEFPVAYADYRRAVEESGRSQKKTDYTDALALAYNGQYDKAIAKLREDCKTHDAYQPMKYIYIRKGDLKSALAYSDSIFISTKGMYQQAIDMTAEELSAQLDNQRLEAETAELELKNAHAVQRTVLIVSILILFFLVLAIVFMKRHVRQLKAANDAKSRFVHNMSHEVRTPLNAIVGFSQILIDEQDITPEDRHEYGQYISENSKMLTTMIDDLLDSVNMESGEYSISISKTNVGAVCLAALRSCESRLQYGVSLSSSSDLPDGYMMKTDQKRLQQILIHLVTNACKNTETGDINLHTAEAGDNVVFTITDTGCGVPIEMASKIFERFYKGNDFRQGAGLGLSLCRDLSIMLGGNLKLDTTYTDGARFVLILPKDGI